MAKEVVRKILQTKIAISVRSIKKNTPSRLSIFQAVKAINEHFKTPATRRAFAGSKAIECRGYHEKDGIIGLYLVGYIPDDSVGIVLHERSELSLLPPPEKADYLDGELIALIAGEDVIVCRLGLFESALNSYVSLLGPAARLDVEDVSYIFKNRTDVDKLAKIQNDGVSIIRFDGAANAASVEAARTAKAKATVQELIAKVWEEARALAHGEDEEGQPDNLKVEVFLKFDKRSGTEVDQQEIVDIAEAISDADDGFEITTLSGEKIRPGDVLLNKPISVPKHGKSVAFHEVFAEMLVYYRDLTTAASTENDA